MLSFFLFLKVLAYLNQAPHTTQDLFKLALKGQIPQEPQGFQGPISLMNFISNNNININNNNNNNNNLIILDGNSHDSCNSRNSVHRNNATNNDNNNNNNNSNNNNNNKNDNNNDNNNNNSNNKDKNNICTGNDGSKLVNNSNKNKHLNPFCEISKMTESDIRNYRYNNGFEETSKW